MKKGVEQRGCAAKGLAMWAKCDKEPPCGNTRVGLGVEDMLGSKEVECKACGQAVGSYAS